MGGFLLISEMPTKDFFFPSCPGSKFLVSRAMPAPDTATIAQVPGGSLGPNPPWEGEPRLLLTQLPSLQCQEGSRTGAPEPP